METGTSFRALGLLDDSGRGGAGEGDWDRNDIKLGQASASQASGWGPGISDRSGSLSLKGPGLMGWELDTRHAHTHTGCFAKNHWVCNGA